MPKKIDPALCAKCKGVRKLCGLPKCPILERLKESFKIENRIKKRILFASSPPSILVGERRYPYVNLGPNIVVDENAKIYDSPEEWWGKKTIEDIIRLRTRMIYSTFNVNIREIRKPNKKLLDIVQQIAVSIRPIDAEYTFKKPPKPSIRFDGILAPVGPRGKVKGIKLVDNPKLPRKVDNLLYDNDVKAVTAIKELFNTGLKYYYITRLFSIGLLGQKRERKIVPTRWAITAVDKILSDQLLIKVKDFNEITNPLLYYVNYVGNKYVIILLPGKWSFEMIEIWLPRTIWVKAEKPYINVNYELYDGRWRIPGVDGGYYAIRYPILEHLYNIKRQAIAIVIREVTRDYYAPLGSWQIRESIRNAFKLKSIKISSIKEAIEKAKRYLITDINTIFLRSHLLKHILYQKKIIKYLNKTD